MHLVVPADVAQRHRQIGRERALKLLDSVGLGGMGKKFPWELSGGMQQRASICPVWLPSMRAWGQACRMSAALGPSPTTTSRACG